MAKDWKERLGIVYSTDPEFSYNTNNKTEQKTLTPDRQLLKVSIDRKQRKGKSVTLVQGFVGSEDDLKDLAKLLKTKCGVGGSGKDGEIIVQGELIEKVKAVLIKEGYRVK
jgi:translation initiation factor 1